MPSETDMIFDWAKGTSFAVTVCDCEGFVIYIRHLGTNLVRKLEKRQ